MTEPQVTAVVVPRERFSYTKQSLESIYQNTRVPFNLIYIDGNSPQHIRQYLEQQSRLKQFRLMRSDAYLSPNQARNMGICEVTTPYVVFIDNDVVVTPGWLERLIQCAEDNDATVVGPLMCQDLPAHEIVHFAGGESHIWTDKLGRRRLREKMYRQGQRVEDVKAALKCQPTELAEFHCVLVRRSIFDRIGSLDESMMNTKEHLDFCMTVREAGESVYFEPDSIVTYVPGPPIHLSDVHFYMLRWSDAWTLSSLNRLREKWELAEDSYFTTKYKKLGWRRRSTIIDPIVRKLTFGYGSRFIVKVLAKVDRLINRMMTNQYQNHQQLNS